MHTQSQQPMCCVQHSMHYVLHAHNRRTDVHASRREWHTRMCRHPWYMPVQHLRLSMHCAYGADHATGTPCTSLSHSRLRAEGREQNAICNGDEGQIMHTPTCSGAISKASISVTGGAIAPSSSAESHTVGIAIEVKLPKVNSGAQVQRQAPSKLWEEGASK